MEEMYRGKECPFCNENSLRLSLLPEVFQKNNTTVYYHTVLQLTCEECFNSKLPEEVADFIAFQLANCEKVGVIVETRNPIEEKVELYER